jgi:hypothetical protein
VGAAMLWVWTRCCCSWRGWGSHPSRILCRRASKVSNKQTQAKEGATLDTTTCGHISEVPAAVDASNSQELGELISGKLTERQLTK